MAVRGHVGWNSPDGHPAISKFITSKNGHQLVNRSDQPARYLEISNRDPADAAE